MQINLSDHYHQEKANILAKCKACGICAQKCPILKHTGLNNTAPITIQKAVKQYLEAGETSDTVYTRAFACMECFQCVDKCCPEGLNPMLINELIKWEYRQKEIAAPLCCDPSIDNAHQRVLAGIQISPGEYRKILTPTGNDAVTNLFFAGCNVYNQPEKLLNALDIMDLISADYAFLPGLDYCCGDPFLFYGSPEKADYAFRQLIEKISAYTPETVIFWCPTCLCRFYSTYAKLDEIPFRMMSFPQFLAAHMVALPQANTIQKTVTLHEACKAAYTGVDVNGARDVLQQLPGIQLVEMPRHGKNTACCGCGAEEYFPNSFEVVRDERLAEAAGTGAELLVDVCHHCHNVFAREEPKFDFSIISYVSLVAEAFGIKREDKFKKYKQWNNLAAILADAGELIASSPFSRKRIEAVIEATFTDKLTSAHP